MDDFLTDEQRADRVKRWLAENGSFGLGGLALAVASLFGWNQWQAYQARQSEAASVVYEEFVGAVRAERLTEAQAFLDELVTDHDGKPYVDQARLALARLHLDRNELDEAAQLIEAVADATASEQVEHIARLRLARIRLHQQQFDAALDALAEGDPNSAFAPRYDEVRGDVYYTMGRLAEARSSYQAALAPGDPGVIDRVFVQAKLDSVAAPSPAAEPVADPASAVDEPAPDE